MALKKIITFVSSAFVSLSALATVNLKVGDSAPLFTVKNFENKDFTLAQRKDKWTVLYFYPKAETPGCTKQACAFRDAIKSITSQGAEVFGISADTVKDQAAFHKNHQLNFDLLADEGAKVSDLYGSRMPIIKISRRWTFIIGPDLTIKSIEKDVDPVKDAERVAGIIAQLKAGAN